MASGSHCWSSMDRSELSVIGCIQACADKQLFKLRERTATGSPGPSLLGSSRPPEAHLGLKPRKPPYVLTFSLDVDNSYCLDHSRSGHFKKSLDKWQPDVGCSVDTHVAALLCTTPWFSTWPCSFPLRAAKPTSMICSLGACSVFPTGAPSLQVRHVSQCESCLIPGKSVHLSRSPRLLYFLSGNVPVGIS